MGLHENLYDKLNMVESCATEFKLLCFVKLKYKQNSHFYFILNMEIYFSLDVLF